METHLSDDTKHRLVASAAGALTTMHERLDSLRDDPEAPHDPRDPIAHNVEQAQIALEVAMMRLEQVSRAIRARSLPDEEGSSCDNYLPPMTCLVASYSESGLCDRCAERAGRG